MIEKVLLPTSTDPLKKPVVLVTTGSFCPVHLGHVQMMLATKTLLELDYGREVIAGFISPKNDRYGNGKLGGSLISAEQRAEMIRLATAEYGWLNVSTWESMSKGKGRVQVLEYIEATVSEHVKRPVEAMYVCGSDLNPVSCAPYTCVVHTRNHKKLQFENNTLNTVIIAESSPNGISSTLVRKRMGSGEAVGDILHPNVEAYLLENRIHERWERKSDG